MRVYIQQIPMRKIVTVVLATLLALTLTVPATAFAEPTAAEKQAEAESALASLNAMQETLNKASDDYFTALAEQEEAKTKMEETQAYIDEISAEIDVVQSKLSTRATSMYRNGSTSFLDILLGAASFEEFINNWDILNRMNQDDADTVERSKSLRAQVEEQKAEYARQEALAAEKAAEMKQIKEEAEATTASMQSLYNSLSAEAAELLEQERAAEEAAAAAQAQAVLDAAAASANSGNTGGGSSGGGSSSGGTGGGGSYNSPAPAPAPSYDVSTGNAIVDRAYSWVGRADYVWGACSPGAFDCSGFVSYCLSGSYSRMGTTYTFLGWPRVGEPQPGDVAVNSGHCGIYIGGGQMIHAATYGVGVVVGPVQGGMVFVRY